MNQYGKWIIASSNDPKVKMLAPPVILDIKPGSFALAEGKIRGSFVFDHAVSEQKKGVYVSMYPFFLPFFKETYNLVTHDPNQLALFGTGKLSSRYYILHRHR